MRAIGSYAVIKRVRFSDCLEMARNVRSETTGSWLFKRTQVVGLEEFREAWRAALLKEVVLDHSGYVLGNYLDVQKAINRMELVNEQSDVRTPENVVVFLIN